MKHGMVLGAFFWLVPTLFATEAPLTLINILSDRPVFSYEVQGVMITRTLAPGNRIQLDAGLFSGLGEKEVPLAEGETYFLARFGALPGVFRLGANQVLILNQTGNSVPVTLEGEATVTGVLASTSCALGGLGPQGSLQVTWEDGKGNKQILSLENGGVYRLILDSPEGLGTTISLKIWD